MFIIENEGCFEVNFDNGTMIRLKNTDELYQIAKWCLEDTAYNHFIDSQESIMDEDYINDEEFLA